MCQLKGGPVTTPGPGLGLEEHGSAHSKTVDAVEEMLGGNFPVL